MRSPVSSSGVWSGSRGGAPSGNRTRVATSLVSCLVGTHVMPLPVPTPPVPWAGMCWTRQQTGCQPTSGARVRWADASSATLHWIRPAWLCVWLLPAVCSKKDDTRDLPVEVGTPLCTHTCEEPAGLGGESGGARPATTLRRRNSASVADAETRRAGCRKDHTALIPEPHTLRVAPGRLGNRRLCTHDPGPRP